MTDITRTSDGVKIEIGLRVFTNDWSWGTVTEPPREWDDRGWWRVQIDADAKYCAGQTKTYNGERMTTRAPAGAPADPRKG